MASFGPFSFANYAFEVVLWVNWCLFEDVLFKEVTIHREAREALPSFKDIKGCKITIHNTIMKKDEPITLSTSN